jgi:hypothetical protein
MQIKSYREQLQDIARTFSKTHSKEYELDDLVSWAIKTKRWSLSQQDMHKIARKQFHDALRLAKDSDGIRVFIDGKLEQKTLWADRHDASWVLRQTFLNEQAKRVEDLRISVIATCQTLNAERKEGEAQFTIAFNWDDEEGQVV